MWTKHKYQYYQQKSNEELVKGHVPELEASLPLSPESSRASASRTRWRLWRGGRGTATLGTVTPWYMLWVGKGFKILLYPLLLILEIDWGVPYGQAWPFLVTFHFSLGRSVCPADVWCSFLRSHCMVWIFSLLINLHWSGLSVWGGCIEVPYSEC